MARNVYVKFFKRAAADKNLAVALDQDLGDVALMTETAIKNKTPVDTGRLKASFVARKVKFLDHEVATNVEYAPHVEYGTRSFSGRSMMRRGAAEIKSLGDKPLRRSRKLS